MGFTNRDVADQWVAHNVRGTLPSHRKSGNHNLSFDGPSLYSYSTEIARLIPAPRNQVMCVVNVARFSPTTTGKHYNARNAALSDVGLDPIVYIDQPKLGFPLFASDTELMDRIIARYGDRVPCVKGNVFFVDRASTSKGDDR